MRPGGVTISWLTLSVMGEHKAEPYAWTPLRLHPNACVVSFDFFFDLRASAQLYLFLLLLYMLPSAKATCLSSFTRIHAPQLCDLWTTLSFEDACGSGGAACLDSAEQEALEAGRTEFGPGDAQDLDHKFVCSCTRRRRKWKSWRPWMTSKRSNWRWWSSRWWRPRITESWWVLLCQFPRGGLSRRQSWRERCFVRSINLTRVRFWRNWHQLDRKLSSIFFLLTDNLMSWSDKEIFHCLKFLNSGPHCESVTNKI